MSRCVLLVRSDDPPARRAEPVTAGVPFPRGLLADPDRLTLVDEHGAPRPVQARALDRWADGSVRWALVDWQADSDGSAEYVLSPSAVAAPRATGPDGHAGGIVVSRDAATGAVRVETGRATFVLRPRGRFPFESCEAERAPALDPSRSALEVEDAGGHIHEARVVAVAIEETGALRSTVRVDGEVGDDGRTSLVALSARFDFFAGSATVRIAITLRNPHRAEHAGGFWELGDSGSVLLRDVTLRLALAAEGAREPVVVGLSAERGLPLEDLSPPLELYQDSSGGDNWRSAVHVNREGRVPISFRGYRVRSGSGGADRTGLRATPVVVACRGGRRLGVVLRHFWQNFPKAIEATSEAVLVRVFPRQFGDLHELQGGEQKTHVLHVALGPDSVTPDAPLDWCRSPAFVGARPSWYCDSGVVPYLIPRDEDASGAYLRLAQAAIEGDDTFQGKRERVDEYGWRNWGEIYADHEAAYYKGAPPVVSHYNNQYDAVLGFGLQFLRTADPRWLSMMDELAAHVVDIDVYHTDRDRAAYSHGLFWHTAHYVHAGRSTHRSYPRGEGLPGGGPANEHAYASGLVLHHFLTGSVASRDCALELASWILGLDDGRDAKLGWLCASDTGLASATYSPSYHGPGRGAGNAISVLLEGHRLTGEARFLSKAEGLIRRCIHPRDDPERHDLRDIEGRWSYTVFLSILGQYLAYKAERDARDAMYVYARESLLTYARWMARHERPTLERTSEVEFPTETWPAQDMRKSDVFALAALYADGAERALFLDRHRSFFDYAVGALLERPTRTRARPVVLLLRSGLLRGFLLASGDALAPGISAAPEEFPPSVRFVPQRQRALHRLLLVGATALATIIALAVMLLIR